MNQLTKKIQEGVKNLNTARAAEVENLIALVKRHNLKKSKKKKNRA